MKKGILIDTENKIVREVTIKRHDSLQEMYNLVNCRLVEKIEVGNRTDLWVDEEGRLNKNENSVWFTIGGSEPFIGNGLLLDHDNNGGSISCSYSLEQIKPLVKFMNMYEVLIHQMSYQHEE
jgi:hypothetical protein